MVCFLEKFPLMDLHDLLNREGYIKSSDAYLRVCFDFILMSSLFSSFFILL